MVSEIECEGLAHRAGFLVSVGNWIAPNGALVTGTNYESHHWETLVEYLGSVPDTDNHLAYMNNKVAEGYIRLVFRAQVMFQVGCNQKEDLWGDDLQFCRMHDILRKISDTEIHVFSKTFYVIGAAKDIVNRNMDSLQIRETKCSTT